MKKPSCWRAFLCYNLPRNPYPSSCEKKFDQADCYACSADLVYASGGVEFGGFGGGISAG